MKQGRTKSGEPIEHTYVGDVCRWCKMRRHWPGGNKPCMGGTVKNNYEQKRKAAAKKNARKERVRYR